jgi:hypothetical protein
MSGGVTQDNRHGYILIDATKYAKRGKRGKVGNSKKNPINAKKGSVVYCVLCGQKVPAGRLLEHKKTAHDEKFVPRSAETVGQKSHWVRLIQGGLPSLGKRR